MSSAGSGRREAAASEGSAGGSDGGDPPAWSQAVAPTAATHVAGTPSTLTALAVASLLGAVAAGEVLFVALAAPLAVAAVAGMARRVPDAPRATVSVDRLSTVEGEPVTVHVEVESDRRIDRLEVALDLDGALVPDPPGPRPARSAPPGRALAVAAGRPRDVEFQLPCPRWGVGTVRAVVLRWRDAAGVATRTARAEAGAVVRVLPASESLRSLLRHDETQLAAGNAVARELGQGIDFGEVRPYVAGDRPRSINWRVTARREGLWVTDRHLERNVDVVLAIDAVLPAALGPAVRAALAIADGYLAERDRVGLIGIGGTLRWLRPGTGGQRYRIVEELISAQAYTVEAAGGLAVPPQMVPPGALVIAVSSLLDHRSAGVLLRLRDRGAAMAVVEVDAPVPPARPETAADLGDRLWHLARGARRDRLRARGVPVARWREGEPLEAAMAEISAYRRALRRPGA